MYLYGTNITDTRCTLCIRIEINHPFVFWFCLIVTSRMIYDFHFSLANTVVLARCGEGCKAIQSRNREGLVEKIRCCLPWKAWRLWAYCVIRTYVRNSWKTVLTCQGFHYPRNARSTNLTLSFFFFYVVLHGYLY